MDGVVIFSGDILLRWDVKAAEFITMEALAVRWVPSGEVQTRVKFTILPGFSTDLGSGLVQVARHLRADLVHDWLYEYHEGLSREEADLLWLDVMRQDDTSWWRRRARYRAVRVSRTAVARWEETP